MGATARPHPKKCATAPPQFDRNKVRYQKFDTMGVSVALSEAEVHWRAFLDSLIKRSLRGVKFIACETQAGLKARATGPSLSSSATTLVTFTTWRTLSKTG